MVGLPLAVALCSARHAVASLLLLATTGRRSSLHAKSLTLKPAQLRTRHTAQAASAQACANLKIPTRSPAVSSANIGTLDPRVR